MTLLSDDEVREFPDLGAARHFLGRAIADPVNRATLRRLLGEFASAEQVLRLADHEVVAAVAARMVRNCVAFVRAPFTSPAPQVTVEPRAPGPPLLGPAPPADVDDLPTPIIPPEYVALAHREGHAIHLAALRFQVELEELRFRGLPAAPASQVAPTLIAVAAESAERVSEAAASLGLTLATLRGGGVSALPESDVAVALLAVAEASAARVVRAAESFGLTLAALQGGGVSAMPESNAAVALRDESTKVSARLRGAVDALTAGLRADLTGAARVEVERTAIGAALEETAQVQSRALVAGAQAFGARLRALTT